MPRGFVWAVYVSDDPIRRWARLVDADQVLDPNRGWTTTGVTDLRPFPTMSRPRRVLGSSPTTGRRGSTVVPNTTAPLWTGAATNFFVETNDGQVDSMTVVKRVGERIRLPRV